jgi:glucose/arabinose dehydrogenase
MSTSGSMRVWLVTNRNGFRTFPVRVVTSIALAAGLIAQASNAQAAFPQIRLEPVVENQIVAPTGLVHAGDGSGRLFVTDQRGTIHVVQDGTLLPNPFLDISNRLVPERAGFDERGLLGLAFHPEFGQAGSVDADKFYVYYSAPSTSAPGTPESPVDHQSVVAEYRLQPGNPQLGDASSERVLMTFNQPQFNHNAGFIDFGPDGYLYIMTGDGGSADDNNAGHTGGDATQPSGVLGNAQDLTKLLGKVLRVDVAGNDGPGGQYGIPADNPFVNQGNGVRSEIYAYGLRNPWRASFDDGPGGSGRLFVADVGQGAIEEINLIEAGGNYGWRIKEGSQDFDATVSPVPPSTLIDPVAEYAHPGVELEMIEVGISVTGGAVYRGSDFPELQGKYIFGDWSTGFRSPDGTLLGLNETAEGDFELFVLDVEGGNPIGQYIQAFGDDEAGELYVATRTTLAPSALDPVTGTPTGSIYRITVVPEPTGGLLLGLGFGMLMGWQRKALRIAGRYSVR